MSIFSKLFGGGASKSTPAEPPQVYKDFTITADPMREGDQYRISARIEREIGGELKSHHLIRADTMGDRDQAVEASIAKAKQMIDEQGNGLFG